MMPGHEPRVIDLFALAANIEVVNFGFESRQRTIPILESNLLISYTAYHVVSFVAHVSDER